MNHHQPLEDQEFDFASAPDGIRELIFEERRVWMELQTAKLLAQLGPSSAPSRQISTYVNASPALEAFAIPHPEQATVSVSAGLCVRLTQLFFLAVRSESLFPRLETEDRYGDDLDLSLGFDSRVLLDDIATEGGLIDPTRIGAPLPQSSERLELARVMSAAAFDFIMMHETAHLLRHHARHLQQGSGELRFREVDIRFSGLGENGSGAVRLRQLLEADADITGAALSAAKFLDSEPWGAWATTRAASLELWFLAVSLFLHLVDGWHHRLSARTTHSHPAVRLMCLAAGPLRIYPDDNEWSETVFESFGPAIHKTRELWAELGLPLDRFSPFADMESLRESAGELFNDLRGIEFGSDRQ